MHFIRVFISIFIVSFLLEGVSVSGTDEDFPKIGFSKNNGANIRAGDNINFESLCKLKKGDPVRIIAKRYSWFKVILPKTAYLYIKNDYVDISTEKETGIVNALHVNLRAGPGTNYSIVGQVSRPERLRVVSEKDGWYKIDAPEKTTGWIHSSQISFKIEGAKSAGRKIKKTNVRLKLKPPAPKGNLIFSGQDN